ncbi:MAG: glycoside hydrolase family 15 protein [Ignavibacteria bacterium]|nr:glycoside hydrolase family 15 protein [Ignavibacteria bacterium]
MKKIITLIFVVASIIFAQNTQQITGKWLFHPGDNVIFADKNLSDNDWSPIQVPGHWENQGYSNLDGFAWYRLHFSVANIKPGQTYYLLAGKIDDADETYLNGKMVGKTGKFPPEADSKWDVQRVYKISGSQLEKTNVLAIRVFDMGGPGGIPGGQFALLNEKAYKNYLKEENTPKPYKYLVTANGLFAAVYDLTTHQIENVFPHIFQMIDDKVPVEPILSNLKPIPGVLPQKVEYYQNTHILREKYPKHEVFYFSPFTLDVPVFVVAIKSSSAELVKNTFVGLETKKQTVLKDSAVNSTGGQWFKYYVLSYKDSGNNEAAVAKVMHTIAENPDLVSSEVNWMKNVFKAAHLPKNVSVKEQALLEQSVAVLKMAQVSQQEIYEKGRGQIVASLPPGIWNISWLRDGCYSLSALVKLGMYKEAKAYINFLLGADVGYYKSFVHTDKKDYGVGQDYLLSVCRYFGNGKEESDFNQDGPNIELDGFGLFLNSFSEYVRAAKDDIMLKEQYQRILDKVVRPLITSIAPNGLVRAESGPWERHLPGKQIAYTSITAAKGLAEYARLLDENKLMNPVEIYNASKQISSAIQQHLVTKAGFIKGTNEAVNESDHELLDAATYEAFLFLPSSFSGIFQSHHDYYMKNLRLGPKRGVKRVNKGDFYDSQEWVFLDCRIISALIKYGKRDEATALRKWVVAQSAKNSNLIAELYYEGNARYEGAVPMVGFGAGAFILTYF